MRRVVFGPSGDLNDMTLETLPPGEPGADEVAIAVKAAGVNFGDAMIVGAGAARGPAITPGYEVAGVVRATGANVRGLLGMRVLGFTGGGGYADDVLVGAKFVYPLPANMDFATGAGFVATYGTAYHGLNDRARLQPGETVIVLGAAGGAGLAAVEIARVMGARVIAAASTPDKLDLCREAGAHDLINYTSDDLAARITALTSGQGVDVVFDPVAGPVVEPCLNALKPLGRYLIIGFASGQTPSIPMVSLLMKQAEAIGVYWGEFHKTNTASARRSIGDLLAWYEAGKLRAFVSKTYNLEQANEALRHLVDRKAKGKIVLVP
jgi:NADPH:quinone reductase